MSNSRVNKVSRKKQNSPRSGLSLKLMLIAALAVAAWAVFGKKGLLEVYRLQQTKNNLQEQQVQLKIENASLQEKILAMKEDKDVIREEIRRSLSYVGEGEILVELKE